MAVAPLHVRDDVDAHASSLRRIETGLAGKGVVVTGASSGIGAACARAFAAEGARVLVHYHLGEERAHEVATAIGAIGVSQADLRVEANADRLFADARSALGSVDVCAAVAGVYPSEDVPLWELPLERWEETLRANLTATFLTARAFLREVARTGRGSLVLVGSTAGVFGEQGHSDYAAAKSAILGGLLLSVKNEVARISKTARVNAVAPGWTTSPMTRGLLDEASVERITRTMPLRKVATAEDVAAQVVVLASDTLSGHVTGQVVTVAGGMEGRVVHAD
jgi:3-oxoacyl-[acyl-carrier protein] reductase